MPLYEYHCPANGARVSVTHSIREDLKSWGELCAKANVPVGETPPDSPVERLLFAAGIATQMGDSHLRNIGFTKLVRRDNGVYENVTAGSNDKRYVHQGDPSSVPNLTDKIRD